MRRLFIISAGILFCLCLHQDLTGQDKLFTQAFAHPVDLNPAFSGQVDGRYRVTIAYRDQWRSILESPFTTMGVYGDIKINLKHQQGDYFGAGFAFITDRTAIYNVNQNVITLYGSYHKSLSKGNKQYLSGGLSMGIAQRNLNYEKIYFNDQFNGLDQYSLPTAEILPSNNFAYADLGLGISYTSAWSRFSHMSIGVAVDHLPGSSVSFYTHSLDQDEDLPDARIDRKLTGYLSMEVGSNEYVSFLPRLLFQKEGPHTMIALAGLVKFDITNYDNQALHLGGGIRINQGPSTGLKPSALYLLTAYEINGLLIGLSHDITLSSLSAQAPGRGAFELSISFTGLYNNEESLCPTF